VLCLLVIISFPCPSLPNWHAFSQAADGDGLSAWLQTTWLAKRLDLDAIAAQLRAAGISDEAELRIRAAAGSLEAALGDDADFASLVAAKLKAALVRHESGDGLEGFSG
jgi:hypothetical protein